MEIRNATLEDAAAVAELAGQLGYPAASDAIANRLNMLQKSDQHAVFVCCNSAGAVTGWLHVFIAYRLESDPFAEIGGFVVSEKYRGSGSGKQLLTAAEKWARDRGMARIRIRSRTTRPVSHSIFIHLGFARTKEQAVFDKQL